MELGLFTVQKAPAVGGSIDREWRKGEKEEKERVKRARGGY